MKKSRLPYTLAMVGLLGFVAFAWLARGFYQPVAAGFPAPGFEALALTGEEVGLGDYEGKVVLLNIWATWCEPCRTEMPSMERLKQEIDSEDFEIVAVSVDARLGEVDAGGRSGGDLARFAEEYGLTFTILHNESGDIQLAYQTTGVPESFLIGPDGVIYRRLAGPTEWDAPEYVTFIRQLLEMAQP